MTRLLMKEEDSASHVDLEATEMAIRTAMHEVGGVLLEKLLDSDRGYRGPSVPCGKHTADFIDYRDKTVLTVLSWIKVRRAYYHCTLCHAGVIPKDSDLDIVSTSFSPGVRRLMGRLGGKVAFDEGRSVLEELAGIVVNAKEVERVSEAIGEQIEAIARKERAAALSGKIVALPRPVPKMYVEMDGTGVPMVSRETEGRQGKDPTGKAKTREAKLGCVFTQTTLDKEGWPVRDDASTTYVGAIETAEEFGRRIFAESIRRGGRCAERIIVLGDGAPWIWNLADEHFPGATQIVDLYHARQHLSGLAKVLYDPGSPKAKNWGDARIAELDTGNVETLVAAMSRLRPTAQVAKDELRKAIDYFETNAERMRYANFRRQGLFVGSGVVEAGCKTIVGRRLKQSGMHWTVRGANAILALRCADVSGRWEQFWETRSA